MTIAAIVLAAGQSKRMGQPKLVLPWGDTTVIERVIGVLSQATLDPILVVTGGAHQAVAALVENSPARPIFNPRFMNDDMIYSLQVGLENLGENVEAAMIALGDQPQIEIVVVRQVLQGFRDTHAALVVPSYQMRRGHPWILNRSLWREIMHLSAPATLRSFLNSYLSLTNFVKVDTPSILKDLDTPEDYTREKPAM